MNTSVKTLSLAEVADVFLGQTFRGKAQSPDSEGQVQLIQIKNLFKGVMKETANLPFAAIEKRKVNVVLKPNDILLPIRGGRLVATLFKPIDSNTLVTTTNQVAIIRSKPDVPIEQNYLLWFLNSEYGIHLLSGLIQSATMQSINKNALAKLQINFPDQQTQYEVSELYLNWLEQEQTLQAIIANGTKLTEKLCSEISIGGEV